MVTEIFVWSSWWGGGVGALWLCSALGLYLDFSVMFAGQRYLNWSFVHSSPAWGCPAVVGSVLSTFALQAGGLWGCRTARAVRCCQIRNLLELAVGKALGVLPALRPQPWCELELGTVGFW